MFTDELGGWTETAFKLEYKIRQITTSQKPGLQLKMTLKNKITKKERDQGISDISKNRPLEWIAGRFGKLG